MSQYNIQLASNLTGVSIHTLRAWEKRYSAVTPQRTSTGRRAYSDDDIKKLQALNDLCSLGHNIGSIANLDIEELNALLKKYGATSQNPTDIKINANPEEAKRSLSHLLIALEGNRLDIISHEIYNLRMVLSPREIALDIISPLMNEIGKRVEKGTFNIAQEHAFSSIIKFHLGNLIYRSYEEKRKSNELYLITSPEGDYHEFGILLASLLCIHYGKSIFYLGPNIPARALVQANESVEATHIILGSTPVTCKQGDNFLTEYIMEVLRASNNKTKVLLGGPGFFDITKFRKKDNFNYLPTLTNLDMFLKENS